MKIRHVHHNFTKALNPRKLTDAIVIHHQAGMNPNTAAGIHDMHIRQRGWAGIGYNFYIWTNGTIETGRPIDMQGAHAGPKANNRSIGICLQGNLDITPPEPAQLESLVWLIGQHIHPRYGKIGITGHNDYMSTSCPGRFFPMERVKKMIEEGHKLQVNGREVTVPVKNEGGRIMLKVQGETRLVWVQARDLAESLGGHIEWDHASKTARMVIR